MDKIVDIYTMRFTDAADQMSYGYEITNDNTKAFDDPFDEEVLDPKVLLETVMMSADKTTQHLLSHVDTHGVKINNKYYDTKFVEQCRNNIFVSNFDE